MKISFVGGGNMAGAIISGLISTGFCKAGEITVCDPDPLKQQTLKERGCRLCDGAVEAAQASEVVILAVKPYVISNVLTQIKDSGKISNRLFISIAAGISQKTIGDLVGSENRVIRVMPNTPAMVGQGMTAICESSQATAEDLHLAEKIFSSVGRSVVVSEQQIDAVTGLSGSGPAYIYMVIEAMADGGVRCGLPRDTAYTLAAQTVLGSAQMVLQTKLHPGALKDMVCSPGGTTIEAVASLEHSGLRSAMIEAVSVCTEKSKNM